MPRTSPAPCSTGTARPSPTDAGIELDDAPAPLFQLLVLAELLSARIGAGIAVAAAVELTRAGWTTAATMRDAPRSPVVAALGRAGYRRYDERTATQLREMAAAGARPVRRRPARAGGGGRRSDVDRAARLVQEVKGIGPTGAAVFLREVQPSGRGSGPYLDDRARAGARRIGLPDDGARLAELVAPGDLAGSPRAWCASARLPPAAQDPLRAPRPRLW